MRRQAFFTEDHTRLLLESSPDGTGYVASCATHGQIHESAEASAAGSAAEDHADDHHGGLTNSFPDLDG